MHVMEIVQEMHRHGWFEDKPAKAIRASMVGTLNRKVDVKDVFTKPAAATYGLVEWSRNGSGQLNIDG
jgi:hypothetical protein